jgi:hypothetical protein
MQCFPLALIDKVRKDHEPAEHSFPITYISPVHTQFFWSAMACRREILRLLTLLGLTSTPAIQEQSFPDRSPSITCPVGHPFIRIRAAAS